MKKLLLLLLFSSLAFGQKIELKKLDSIQFEKNTQEILSNTGKKFKLIEKGDKDWKKYNLYVNEADNNEIFFIVYYIRNEGENKDLEIKGTKKWSFDSLASKYLTIFDLYQKYYNPQANKEEIQKAGRDDKSYAKDVTIRKTSMENIWELKIWP